MCTAGHRVSLTITGPGPSFFVWLTVVLVVVKVLMLMAVTMFLLSLSLSSNHLLIKRRLCEFSYSLVTFPSLTSFFFLRYFFHFFHFTRWSIVESRRLRPIYNSERKNKSISCSHGDKIDYDLNKLLS